MHKTHKVVIIGGGISAVGASLQLEKHKIEHIILQGRDRMGGRITSLTFDGVGVELGASFIHKPHVNNPVAELMKQKGWKGNQMEYLGHDFYEQGCRGNQNFFNDLFEEQRECIKMFAQAAGHDLSVEEAAQPFLREAVDGEKKELIDSMKWNIQLLGNMAGTEPSQLSALYNDLFESEEDMLPEGGYSSMLKQITSTLTAPIQLNQRVTKIDYSKEIIEIHTTDNVYFAQKIISSLPLGVMQSGTVQFYPKLPELHQEIIGKIGNGNANKLFVSFEEAFWDLSKNWIYFLYTEGYNKYPVATPILKEGKWILCFFLSGKTNELVGGLSDKEIVEDLLSFLAKFKIQKEVRVKDYFVTRWHKDPFSMGSYSFMKVGLTPQEVDSLRSPISDKIWMVGQHCRPLDISCSHAAFETGMWAADQIAQRLQQST